MKKLKCDCGGETFKIVYEPAEDGVIYDVLAKCIDCGRKITIRAVWNDDDAFIDIYGEDIDVYE